ncbi:hypothetical protein GCM10010912_58930 [Paenibacillus albidus]|uniref:Uncharacterized protein n=1 Tax=Paenibacillus albidus TaxID=2041023 RepID=A0A917FUI6_9BACL|nr:hypothetical protein [Paenibacillus albidus]GGG06532.1 hypothetical protein GCM10010912_58930 [Paenibacillus albidus]
MSNTYTNHRIKEAQPDFEGVNGTYFNASAYFFYHKRSSTVGDRILYTRIHLKIDQGKETLETLKANVEIHNNKNYNVNGHSEISNLASVVHQGVLYLFWTENGDLWYKKTANGENWTKEEKLHHAFERRSQFAALSLNGRIYLIGGRHIDSEHRLVTLYMDNEGIWHSEVDNGWKNIKNISASAYHDSTGKLSLMIGVVTTHANLWTACYQCEVNSKGEGSGLRQIISHHHQEYDGLVDFIALETGTVQQGIHDSAVQLFINGWHRPHIWAGYKNNQMKEYNIRTGTWGPKITRSHGHTKYPTWKYMGALQYFVPNGDNGEMQQEIWLYMNYNDDSVLKPGSSNLVFCRYKSSQFKLIATEDATVSEDFRALIGVVEGAPPYVRNGSESDSFGSSFFYGRSQTEQMSISTQFNMGAYVQAGSSLPVVADVTLKFSTEHAEAFNQITEITTSFDKSIVPVPGENAVTYIYLAPHVVKRTYELYDWNGTHPLGIKSYLFHATSADVDFDVHNILHTYEKHPNTHDYKSFEHRFPSLPSYVDHKRSLSLDISWVPGEITVFFHRKTAAVEIERSKVSAEITQGVPNIFNIGGNASYEYEISHYSDVSEKVGAKLDFPFPRNDHPEDVKKMVVRMFVFVPDENQLQHCYWIPKGQQNQRPWCVAWSVQGVKHQGS